MGFTDVDSDNQPVSFQQIFEAKRFAHMEQLQHDEDEMREMFVVRVKEKEAELKEIEREVMPVANVHRYCFSLDLQCWKLTIIFMFTWSSLIILHCIFALYFSFSVVNICVWRTV